MTALIAARWVGLFLILLSLILLPFVLFEHEISVATTKLLQSAGRQESIAILVASALALDALLPIPSSLVNTFAGAALGLPLATFACWAGMTAGCLLGYWIGATGGVAVIRRLMGEQEVARAERVMGAVGLASLILARAAPVLAEASTIAAGAARYPLAKFTVVVALGNLGIAATYAAIGAYAYNVNSFLLALAGALGVPAIGLGLHRLYAMSKARFHADGGDPRLYGLRPARTARGAGALGSSTIEWQRFAVRYEYPVAFTRGLFDPENSLFAWALGLREDAKRHRCMVFIDCGVVEVFPDIAERIARYCDAHAGRIALACPPIALPGGEAAKENLACVETIHDALQERGIDRHSFAVTIGGGALLDVVGFAAATAHRGVRHIRVPTTVLAQCDSGVGVKNAVNRKGVKNFVGTFAPPWAVLNDLDFLACLPHRDRISGAAEAVKVALIRDRAFFEWLEANVSELAACATGAEEEMVRRCAALHLRQITKGGDPFETGSARPLDFGHWSAHKLESMSEYELRHGEAVAIGIALDARYSAEADLLGEAQCERIYGLLKGLGFHLWHPALARRDAEGRLEVLGGLAEFQRHLGGELTVTLLHDIDAALEVKAMDAGLVVRALDWLAAREG